MDSTAHLWLWVTEETTPKTNGPTKAENFQLTA